jgi:cellulose 1,4-beta-cellobiosidase
MEGGTNAFRVRLLNAPASNVSITTTRTSGNTNLNVAAGATLTFTPANWNVFQPVVVAAAEDGNTSAETATFTVANSASQQLVTVLGLDNDSEVVRIVAVELTGGNVLIRFTSTAGQVYRVERTSNLGTPQWSPVGSDVAGTGAVIAVTDFGGAGQAGRFYRVALFPQ